DAAELPCGIRAPAALRFPTALRFEAALRFAAALRLAATLRIPAALRPAALRFPTVLWATAELLGLARRPRSRSRPGAVRLTAPPLSSCSKSFRSQPSYGPQQSSSVSHASHGPAAARPLFASQLLPRQAFGTGSEGFWQSFPSDRNAAVWSHIGSIPLGWLVPL